MINERKRFRWVLIITLTVGLVLSCESRQAPELDRIGFAGGGQNVNADSANVTFFFCADTHYSAALLNLRNRAQIQAMNSLPGTPWPDSIGGVVDVPLGVLVGGDLTNEMYMPDEAIGWDRFKAGYEDTLQFPLYECSGNHDRAYTKARVAERHGSLLYKWEWNGVWFYSLDEIPTFEASAWIDTELGLIDDAPAVLMHHYGADSFSIDCGPTGGGGCFTVEQRATYRAAIEDDNIVAIFHGHCHKPTIESHWGFDWYNPSSTSGDTAPSGIFLVTRITDSTITVAQYRWNMDETGNFTYGVWKQVRHKSIVPDPPSGIK